MIEVGKCYTMDIIQFNGVVSFYVLTKDSNGEIEARVCNSKKDNFI